MATGRDSSKTNSQPRRRAVALTNAPDVFPVLPDEIALIVLHLCADLVTILNGDQ